MTARAHSPGHLALKAAFRRLAKLAGGMESAASITRVSFGQIAKYGRVHDEQFAPLDVVADLEADTGEALVTRELAGLAGYLLIAKPPAQAGAAWIAAIGDVSREVGEVVGRCCEALNVGGRISATEIRELNLRGEVRDAMEALARIDAALAVVEAASHDDGKV